MKILIVSNAFYPENSPRSFRTTELAKEFSRQGHTVTIITHADPAQDKLIEAYGFNVKPIPKPAWSGFRLRNQGISRLISRVLVRLSDWLFELPMVQLVPIVARALREESGYDLLISIAVPFPVHWGVAKAQRANHRIAKTWVADCGDPYMGQENDTFTPPFYFGYVEKWFCRKADFLTVPVTGAIAAYYPEFHDKIKVIPQGFRFEDFQAQGERLPNPQVTFGYAGHLMPGMRDPSRFLQYLVDLEMDYRFHLYTRSVGLVAPYAQASGGRIIVHDYVSREELLLRFSQMDFVVNFENVGTKQTPSKLIDYAIIERPILSVRSEQLQTDNIDAFLKGDYSGQITVENPDQYRIENVVRKFIDLGQ